MGASLMAQPATLLTRLTNLATLQIRRSGHFQSVTRFFKIFSPGVPVLHSGAPLVQYACCSGRHFLLGGAAECCQLLQHHAQDPALHFILMVMCFTRRSLPALRQCRCCAAAPAARCRPTSQRWKWPTPRRRLPRPSLPRASRPRTRVGLAVATSL